MAPADALVSESITKNSTRAFSLARCSRAMRSGVHCETCCVIDSSVSNGNGKRWSVEATYRVIKRNAKFLELRHSDVGAPGRWVAGAAEEDFRRLDDGLLAVESICCRLRFEHDLLLYPKRAFRRE